MTETGREFGGHLAAKQAMPSRALQSEGVQTLYGLSHREKEKVGSAWRHAESGRNDLTVLSDQGSNNDGRYLRPSGRFDDHDGLPAWLAARVGRPAGNPGVNEMAPHRSNSVMHTTRIWGTADARPVTARKANPKPSLSNQEGLSTMHVASFFADEIDECCLTRQTRQTRQPARDEDIVSSRQECREVAEMTTRRASGYLSNSKISGNTAASRSSKRRMRASTPRRARQARTCMLPWHWVRTRTACPRSTPMDCRRTTSHSGLVARREIHWGRSAALAGKSILLWKSSTNPGCCAWKVARRRRLIERG